jgi:hypothetical protein
MRRKRQKHLETPTRKLREILAVRDNPWNRGAVSQRSFSEISDVPLDTLRSLESRGSKGMRFSPSIQSRIQMNTGAVWNEKDERWRFWSQDGPEYTRKHFEQYRELMMKHAEGIMPQFDLFFAAARIRLLLETLPPQARMKFFFRLNAFLGESRKEFCPNHFAEFFHDASGLVFARPELDRDHPMNVRRIYLPRVTEHAPKLKKLEEWAKEVRFDLTGYEKEIRQRPQWGLPPASLFVEMQSARLRRGAVPESGE